MLAEVGPGRTAHYSCTGEAAVPSRSRGVALSLSGIYTSTATFSRLSFVCACAGAVRVSPSVSILLACVLPVCPIHWSGDRGYVSACPDGAPSFPRAGSIRKTFPMPSLRTALHDGPVGRAVATALCVFDYAWDPARVVRASHTRGMFVRRVPVAVNTHLFASAAARRLFS